MPANDSLNKPGVDTTEDDDDNPEPRRPATGQTPTTRHRRRLPIIAMAAAVAVIIAVVAVIASNGSKTKSPAKAKPPPVNAAFTTFNDKAAGFSVSYPPAWTAVKTTDPAVPLLLNIGVQGLDTLLVRVVALQTSVDTTSVASMKAFTDSIISGANVTVLQQQSITIQNVPGYYYFYTLPKDPTTGVTLVHSHFFVFPPKQMVSLTFQTVDNDFARLAPTFDQVVASLRVTTAQP